VAQKAFDEEKIQYFTPMLTTVTAHISLNIVEILEDKHFES